MTLRAALLLLSLLLLTPVLHAQEPDAAAQAAVSAKNFSGAREMYLQLSRKYPDNMDYLNWAARLSGWLGDYATAAAIYDRVLQRDPRNTDAMVGKAYVMMWQGRLDDAQTLLEKARQIKPGAPDTLEALAALQRIKTGDARVQEAQDAIHNNDLRRARDIYDQLAREHPEDLDYQIEAARIAGWMQDYPAATAGYDAVLRKDPGNVEAMVGEAYILMWQGKYGEAREILDRANNRAPESVEVNLALGRLYYYEDYDELAAPYIDKVLAKNPGDAEALAVKSNLVPYHPWVLRTGYEHDWFNFFTPANTGTVQFGHDAHGLQLLANWEYYDRFGKNEQRFGASIVDRINPKTFVRGRFLYAPGGATVIPREDLGAGISRVVGYGFVPGFDYTYLHFSIANVHMMMPSLEYYLPNYPIWLRFVFFETVTEFTNNAGANNQQTYLGQYSQKFSEHLTGHIGYAYGGESFSTFTSDRIGSFVGNTVFGSIDVALSSQYGVSIYGNRQARSNGQRVTVFGVQVTIRQ